MNGKKGDGEKGDGEINNVQSFSLLVTNLEDQPQGKWFAMAMGNSDSFCFLAKD